ncbi:uncharacterized protein LOC144631738 [Oculina patagonica]
MSFFHFQSPLVFVLLLLRIKVLQCANKLEVEVDLKSGRVIPSIDAVKSHVSFIHGPTASSAPDRCDGQAVARLDFSGPYKKAKIELIYGKEPRLWTASISAAPTSYGFGWNYGYSSNCAAAEVYNHQFRVYGNKLPGFLYHTMDGNSLMATADEVVEKGANMTIDITDEAVSWKTHFVNSSEPYWDDIKNSRHLFTLSEQEPTFGPPTDSFIYAGFNRVPYGNFHNGSGLCRVRITFKREIGKDASCATGAHDCHRNAKCRPTKRSYKCICMPGYLGDGRKCKEYDPCSINNGGCQHVCRHITEGHFSCSCYEGYELHPNRRDCVAKEEVSKRVRVRLTPVSLCKSKDIEDLFLTKLQKKLLSQEVCNFPCKIFKPSLRCKHLKRGVVSVNFDIQMNQNVISTSKFCNNTCARCQMEERLQKLISELRMLADNSKLNVSLYDQTFTITKKTLRVTKENDHCSKERTRRKIKRQARCHPGTYFDVFLRKCMNCSRGSYQPNRSENFCFRCPDTKTTVNTGASDISQCIDTKCGGNLTSMTGVITSPNHPDPYPKGVECVWHIRCPEGRGLLMLIPNISIPLTKDCSDHLIMRENASPFSKTTYYACESYSNPVAFISRSQDLYIKFTSKSNNEMAEGFKIFYVTFQEKYRHLVESIVQDGDLYGNSSLRRILQDEKLITQILDIMVHPQKFFEIEPSKPQNKLPEFYAFVAKKVDDFLDIRPYKRK